MDKLIKGFIEKLNTLYDLVEFKDNTVYWNSKQIMKISYKHGAMMVISTDGSGRESFVKSEADLIEEFKLGYSIAAGNVCTI